MTEQEKQKLNEKLARHFLGIKKTYYDDWDTEKQYPMYIPSGKPWRTYRIDAKPVPKFTDPDYGIAYVFRLIVPKLAQMPNLHIIDYQYIGFAQDTDLLRHGWLILLTDSEGEYAANENEPALAFCLAVEKLIDKERQ